MIPDGWNIYDFETLFQIKSGFGFKFSEYKETGIPLIKIENVSHGKIEWNSISYLPETYQEKYSDLLLRENDVVVALNRPITQNKLNIARITNKDLPSILYQRVGKIISLKQIVDKNFSYYLLSDVIFRFVLRGAIGSDQP